MAFGEQMNIKLLWFFLLLIPTFVKADVLVLVHGWASTPETWGVSGVQSVLAKKGWKDAGILPYPSRIASNHTNINNGNGKIYYRIHLPSHAPIAIQSTVLLNAVKTIKGKHSGDRIFLAAHSAGGLAARLMLLNPDAPKISKLITIATPNLGTSRAVQGLDYAESKPFFCPGPGIDFLKTAAGGDKYRYVKYSRPAIVDMLPAQYGGFIHWLNSQPHPAIQYYSIVKIADGYPGDEMVSAVSQNLANVKMITSKVVTIDTRSGHALNPQDGYILESILTGKYD